MIFVFIIIIFAGYGLEFLGKLLKNNTLQKLMYMIVLIVSILNLFYVFYLYHPLVAYSDFSQTPQIALKLQELGAVRIYVHKANMRTFNEFNNTIQNKVPRYLSLQNDLVPNSNIIWKIPSSAFYSSFGPKRLYYFMSLFEDSYSPSSSASSQISFAGLRMLSIRNTDTIVSPIKLHNDALKFAAQFKLTDLENQYTYIYRNDDVLPEVYAYSNLSDISTFKDFVKLMSNQSFDIKKQALIENRDFDFQSEHELEFEASSISKSSAYYRFNIKLNQQALITLARTYYPGWFVKVDGKVTKIYPVNLVNMGTIVSEGNHIVEFVFNPLSFRIGMLITVSGYLIIAFLFLIKRRIINEL
ncbi:hypothetical protein A2154_04935 [Candidatus Gottesmanbacteria bacterium RBG_16_43_7]|uniref:Uncharacterized protein n=1 Tax=Candidatus Gottesmanbacteria bacterium RBG_16_43_7 TaxID=1798373 RepID=A0A1F5ZCL8_9BACT|nr:MAG: hypothetical protein A2154_04935 [Candidatus Gottesmanbacteria bacterium RBG_16_43_7]